MATADRYQVIVSLDASQLPEPDLADQSQNHQGNCAPPAPTKRPSIQGAGPIAKETARRIGCDCSVSTLTHEGGEPVDIGRKSRVWPQAMARAIKSRDQHCQYPGCTQSRHLQIHHIQHWADGGSTCVDNGVCLCSHHHTVVHEGGFRIERVNDLVNGRNEQFQRQQATPQTFNEVERLLRNSRESFEQVCNVSPTRFRFRIVNGKGLDIRDVRDVRDVRDENNEQNEHKASVCSQSDTGSTRIERPFHDQWREETNGPDTAKPPVSSSAKPPGNWPGVAEEAARYRVAGSCL